MPKRILFVIVLENCMLFISMQKINHLLGSCGFFYMLNGACLIIRLSIQPARKIITSYYCGPPDIETAISLIETRAIEVDDLITRQLPLQNVADGFRMVMEGRETLKVIIKPHH